jgi:hypothetical protein
MSRDFDIILSLMITFSLTAQVYDLGICTKTLVTSVCKMS